MILPNRKCSNKGIKFVELFSKDDKSPLIEIITAP